MNIAIVGAGAVGIASAYALALDGHTVTVYESHRAAAEEASFAPTGWLTPAVLQPWSMPGLAQRLHASPQPGRQATLRLGSGFSSHDLGWLLHARRNAKLLRKNPPPLLHAAPPAAASHSTANTPDNTASDISTSAPSEAADKAGPDLPPQALTDDRAMRPVQELADNASPVVNEKPAEKSAPQGGTLEAAPEGATPSAAGATPAPLHPAWAKLLNLEHLAQYSAYLRQKNWLRWEYEPEATQGSLLLMSTAAERAALQPLVALLEQAGVALTELDAAATRRLEPGLSETVALAGALYCAKGTAANGRLAAQVQRHIALQLGVKFVHSQTVTQLQPATGGQSAQVVLSHQGQHSSQSHDAIVVCTGAKAAPLLRPLGIQLPTVHLSGYTVNAPLRDATRMPRHAIVDWTEQLTITPQGLRLRMGAGAELGSGTALHQPTLTRMYHRLQSLFPGSALLNSSAQVWRGTRVCSPDGLPIVGAAGKANGIWLNLAHGACGSAVVEGCAQVLCDLMAQRAPAIEAQALSLARFA